jgi:HNH endonuclease
LFHLLVPGGKWQTETAKPVSSASLCSLILTADASLSHEVDHVISRQHGGATVLASVACACWLCNRYKGINLTSVDPVGSVVRLYDPRTDLWRVHFGLAAAVIQPLTPVGAPTARLLRFDSAERVVGRALLQRLGRYPRS